MIEHPARLSGIALWKFEMLTLSSFSLTIIHFRVSFDFQFLNELFSFPRGFLVLL